VGLPPISKSLILQGFISQKFRSVTAFWYTKVVHCAAHSSRPISDGQGYSLQLRFNCLDTDPLDYGSHLLD
jgi:hypothetical protein